MDNVATWTGRESRALRMALRMSVRDFASHLGVGVRTIAKWEACGEARTPRPHMQATLDVASHRMTTQERERFRDLIGGEDRTGCSEPVPYVLTPEPTTDNRTERDLLKMAANRARQFSLFSEENISTGMVEQLYADVEHCARVYQSQPLRELLGDLVSVQDNLYLALEQRQRPNQARQLYLLAGVTGGLLSKVSHDFAEPHAAMTQARSAYLCAEAADHNGLRVWIRGLQALIAYWSGRYGDSLKYAQHGTSLAGAEGGTNQTWLIASEARAWGALGNVEAATRLVTRAEESYPDAVQNELDTIGGICSFSDARRTYYAADALVWLPSEAATASDYAVRAVEAYRDHNAQDWSYADQAGSYADLAIARINQGDLKGAAAALEPIWELPIDRRINGVVQSARNVAAALRNSRLGREMGAEPIREQIESFSRTPIAALSQ